MTSLDSSDYIPIMYSVYHYNRKMLLGVSSLTVADTLKVSAEAEDKKNIILSLVLSNFKVIPNWIEFYGLNIVETMELDFSNYHLMIKEIQSFNKLIASAEEDSREPT